MAGIIAGIIGGIVVGALSGSPLSVSGPAAGLTAIVAGALDSLHIWPAFLLAVVIAGALQLVAGQLKLGGFADFVPNAAIRGMLAAIGLLLILKQFPHLVGYDKDYSGDMAFAQEDGDNTFTALQHALGAFNATATVIGGVSVALLWLWEQRWFKQLPVIAAVPGQLVVVVAAMVLAQSLGQSDAGWQMQADHFVQLPISDGPVQLLSHLQFVDFGHWSNPKVWTAGITLAIVASLETLLGIAAVDKLDTLNRVSPPNRELLAQGAGNMLSGLLGGLPMTSVAVRSSANVAAGAQSRLSTMLHGMLLLLVALFFAKWLNKIPLAALAAILVFTGYKLAKLKIFLELWRKGRGQFIPFVATIIAVLATNLLTGILIGIAIGLFVQLRANFRTALSLVQDGNNYLLRLRKDASFFIKPALRRMLETIPANSYLIIDLSRAELIDDDIVDVLNEFAHHAALKKIQVEVQRNPARPTHTALKLEFPSCPEPDQTAREVTP